METEVIDIITLESEAVPVLPTGQNARVRTTALRNGLWNALGNVVNLATGITGSLIVVRTLSTTSYGTLSYYLWLSSVLGVLGLWAFPTGHTKIVSELNGEGEADAANQLSAWATGTVLLLNVCLALCLVGYGVVFAPVGERSYAFIVAGMLIPNSLATMLGSRLAALGRYSWSSMGLQTASIIQLGLLVWGYFQHWSVGAYMFALLSPTLFQLCFLLSGNRDSLRIYKRVFRRPNPSVLRKYLQFFFPMTLVVLYERIVWDRSEILFLKLFSNLSQIGFYNLAYTTFSMFLNLGLALINGYWPAISNDYGAGNIDGIRHKIRKGVLLSFLYTVPLAFGGLMTLPTLITFMYGHKMATSGLVTTVLIVGLIPGVVNGMFSLTLSAGGHVWANVRTGLVTSIIAMGLDGILVAHLGALGGAIGCAAAQLINCLILMRIVLKRLQVRLLWRKMVEITGVGAVTTMGIPAIFLSIHSGIIMLVSSILLAGLCYGLCVWKFGYLRLVRES